MKKSMVIAMCCGLVVAGAAATAEAASFQGLGFAGKAEGVSADGLVAVGQAGSLAYVWTAGGGAVALPHLPGYTGKSVAYDVSGDGTVIVGYSNTSSTYRAVRWVRGGDGSYAVEDLGFNGWGWGISRDGSVVVGEDRTGGTWAYGWTSSGGKTVLPKLAENDSQSKAYAASADGSAIIGTTTHTGGATEAFRWTSAGGIVGLGVGSYAKSLAEDISEDGAVVVGRIVTSDSKQVAYRWTEIGGIDLLHAVDDSVWSASTAFAVSADGSIAAGRAKMNGSITDTAFVWDAFNGMQDLKTLLESQGLDLTGWTLTTAWGTTPDGLTLVGHGMNPSGQTEAWIATLNSVPTTVIPEPLTMVGLAVGAAGLARYLRRRRMA